MKILIADDEDKIRDVLKEYAEINGYEVITAADGVQAVSAALNNDVDVIVMDIMMPNLDGFSAVKQIRKVKNVPIIVLSARTEEYDKLHAFDIGADDYVSKPFSPKEVMARIAAMFKRSNEKKTGLKLEGLEIDFEGRNVFVDGNKALLTPKEYDLLFYMVKNSGIVLSRDKLLSEIWGYDFIGDDRTVDTHIKTLRSHLKSYRSRIVTVRGVGYKFERN